MPNRTSTTRFPITVDAALRAAGWQPGRWDIKQAEIWADTLRAHTTPGGHEHTVSPAAVECWAEFGGLRIAPKGPGRQLTPSTFRIDPLAGLHMARTLADLGRALETELCPLGERPPPTPPPPSPSSPSTPRAASTPSTTPATGTWAPTSTPPSPPCSREHPRYD